MSGFEDFNLVITPWVSEKLKIHKVEPLEVEEAMANMQPPYIEEVRPEHRTRPPSFWCISETADGRLLKISFVLYPEQKIFRLKSAYDPEPWEIDEYESH